MNPRSDENPNLPKYTLDPRPPRMRMPPFWMTAVALIAVVASWLPLVLFARARAATSPKPRVQLMQDMGLQPKYREQQSSTVFADGRADRPRVENTIARGELHDDDFFYRGYSRKLDEKTGKVEVKFYEGFPPQLRIDAKFVARGQERFNIYCSACHGLDGYGHGPVNERALELMHEDTPKATWVQAADLTKEPVKSRPEGHIYNTINVGIRNMPPYGPQIPVEDRWAIVAYVKSLQLSQDVNRSQVSEQVMKEISH